jgi:hypothetical protein
MKPATLKLATVTTIRSQAVFTSIKTCFCQIDMNLRTSHQGIKGKQVLHRYEFSEQNTCQLLLVSTFVKKVTDPLITAASIVTKDFPTENNNIIRIF